MTVTVRKAGEVAAKAAARTVLRPPRAVTAAEAPQFQPARESTKTTMMPWKGWFQRLLQDQLGEERFQKIRNIMLFAPDDIYDLQQSPKPNQKIPIANDPSITHMYRYPSPGSQTPVKLPEFEEGEDPYDTGYFKKDTRRRYLSSELGNPDVERAKLEMMDPDGQNPLVQSELQKINAGPESSKGNKGVFATGPSDFDPTGLRATMSVTWSEVEKSLDAHMPDHIPEPCWMKHKTDWEKFYTDRDLPVPVGEYYKPLKVPVERRVATW
jgi:hypothetical protein